MDEEERKELEKYRLEVRRHVELRTERCAECEQALNSVKSSLSKIRLDRGLLGVDTRELKSGQTFRKDLERKIIILEAQLSEAQSELNKALVRLKSVEQDLEKD